MEILANGQEWLIIAGIAVFGVIIIRWASKLMARIIGILFVLLAVFGVMYALGIGPFRQKVASIENFRERYCISEESKNKCDCIVDKIEDDIQKRFTAAEIRELEKDKLKLYYVLTKSYEAKQSEIKSCLKARDAEDEMEEFLKDLIPDDGLIGRAREWLEEAGDSASEKIDDLKSDKEDIDKRY